MTLGKLVLKKSLTLVQYPSPPPEVEEMKFKRKKSKLPHVKPKVDAQSPRLDANVRYRNLESYANRSTRIVNENIKLLNAIMYYHLIGGKVDSHWNNLPKQNVLYYYKRKDFWNRINKSNLKLYLLLKSIGPKVTTTKELLESWEKNRKEILLKAQKPFILFPPDDICEDVLFRCPCGVKRPRVYLELKTRNWYVIGDIEIELFTDVCPHTCALFLELLAGHPSGFGYVGTRFYRKVPKLYWSGGDVIYNNGFGCYAQKGHTQPIGAENYKYSHSIPGLLSMRVTHNDEMCGIFNITFKPLPQLDSGNVVFGRVIRPSATWNKMRELGSPMSSYPCVELSGAKYQHNGKWCRGVPNCKTFK